jgi:glycosyltransferase involved in cell wall biosynthesis
MDSACASVSVRDDDRATVDGLPCAAIDQPVCGVVLVSRDHLLLALDEVALLAHDEVQLVDVDGQSPVDQVLASLVRPGFVHRACGSRGAVVRRPAASSRRTSAGTGRIVIDGRALGYPVTGTQVQLIGLLSGLVRAGADVAVLGPAEIHPTVGTVLGPLRTAVPFVDRANVGFPAIFHRPSQVGSLQGLAECLSIGGRLVLTHQDMIADRSSAYAPNASSWLRYRATTVAALASADQIGFFSRHAALDAASDGALELDRATVVSLGVDHLGDTAGVDPADPLAGRPYLLMLGNAYWHKNRLFALRMLEWLVEQRGWDGGLVLAGGHPSVGSSRSAEAVLRARARSLEGRVAELTHVPHGQQASLYRGAELVLFPSLYEGFGLIPFEAAAMGKACVYSHRSSMRELLPEAGALPSFDLEESGPFVFDLLESNAARERVVEAIAEAARGLTWNRTAAGYLEVYGRALDREPRAVSRTVLSAVLDDGPDVTGGAAVVLDVYRRRASFRLLVDATIRAGRFGRRMLRRR